jgi:signal peptidase
MAKQTRTIDPTDCTEECAAVCTDECVSVCTDEHHHHRHLELHAHGRRHRLHDALDLAILLLIGLTAWYLWPASLGGSTRFIVVQGESMEPRYHIGDVVMVKANDHPHIGDIIVFSVPEGEPGEGMLVVHRVHSVRPDGTYETKGDNRAMPDNWNVRSKDILGVPQLTLPKFGRMIGIFANPYLVGGAAGGLTVMFLWPKRKDQTAGPSDDDRSPDGSGDEDGAVHVDAASSEPSRLLADTDEELVETT